MTPETSGHRRLDLIVRDTGFRRDRDRRERIERVVRARDRNRPAFELLRPALDARRRGSHRSMSCCPSMRADSQYEIGFLALTVGEQPAAVRAKIEALHHVTHDRMIDAGDRQAEERNILEEGFVFAVHRFDRAEVVEMLGIDIRDDRRSQSAAA